MLRILKNQRGGVGECIGLYRGVLALSHRKQSEDFFNEKTAGLLTQKLARRQPCLLSHSALFFVRQRPAISAGPCHSALFFVRHCQFIIFIRISENALKKGGAEKAVRLHWADTENLSSRKIQSGLQRRTRRGSPAASRIFPREPFFSDMSRKISRKK